MAINVLFQKREKEFVFEYNKKIRSHILILSNSSSGLYEFRNEVVEDLLRDHEVFISLPDENATSGRDIVTTP